MPALKLQSVLRLAPRSTAPGVPGGAVAGGSAPILEGITLQVARGEWLNVVGPSGAGKSRLLRLLNRLDEADGGAIEVLGQALEAWPVRQLRRKVGFVFQEPILVEDTVRDALTLPWRLWKDRGSRRGSKGDAAAESAPTDQALSETLQAAGLPPEVLGRDCGGLSVGQRQRVAIARVLLTRPDVLLLDEPTSGLDEQSADQLLRHLQRLNREQGLTVLIVNHRLAEVRRLGGRMVVLMAGRVAADGDVEALFARSPEDPVGQFLTGFEARERPQQPPAAAAAAPTTETP